MNNILLLFFSLLRIIRDDDTTTIPKQWMQELFQMVSWSENCLFWRFRVLLFQWLLFCFRVVNVYPGLIYTDYSVQNLQILFKSLNASNLRSSILESILQKFSSKPNRHKQCDVLVNMKYQVIQLYILVQFVAMIISCNELHRCFQALTEKCVVQASGHLELRFFLS